MPTWTPTPRRWGAAQVLPDGNLAFNSGFQSNNSSETIEVLPDGTQTFVQSISGYEYRSYLTSSLYIDPSSSPAPIPPPIIGGTPVAVNASQNVALVNQRAGTFTYPLASLFPTGTTLPAGLPASDFTATINWGDSTSTTAGTITQDTVNPDLYYVSGSHTYATAATYTISMTVTLKAATITGTLDNTPITLDHPAISVLGTSATANVATRTIAVTAFAVAGTEGSPIPAGPIATFIDSAAPNPDSDYSASITIAGADGFSLVIPAASITEFGTTNQYTVSCADIHVARRGNLPDHYFSDRRGKYATVHGVEFLYGHDRRRTAHRRAVSDLRPPRRRHGFFRSHRYIHRRQPGRSAQRLQRGH